MTYSKLKFARLDIDSSYSVTVTAVRVRDRKLATVTTSAARISDARSAAVKQLNDELGTGQWRVVCRDEAPADATPTHWDARVSNRSAA